jgi:hypothetical protein
LPVNLCLFRKAVLNEHASAAIVNVEHRIVKYRCIQQPRSVSTSRAATAPACVNRTSGLGAGGLQVQSSSDFDQPRNDPSFCNTERASDFGSGVHRFDSGSREFAISRRPRLMRLVSAARKVSISSRNREREQHSLY